MAHQDYRVDVHLESVILGNGVIFGNVQSFVADFVSVTAHNKLLRVARPIKRR